MKDHLIQIMMIVSLLASSSCSPLFSDLQSARLVGKGEVEITPGYSTVNFTSPSSVSPESTGDFIGLQTAVGLSDKTEFRVRYEHFHDSYLTAEVLSIGLKFRMVKDRAAFYLPLGFVNFAPAQLQPTFLFTLPIHKNKIEFNPSVKHIIPLGGYDPTRSFLVAFNAGLAFSSDLSKWAFRTEYGQLYNTGEKGHYGNFSIGLSLNLSALKKKTN